MTLIARVLSTGRLQTDCSGRDNIPADGPALIVARHYHHAYDGLALFAALPRPFHIVVTLDWTRNYPTKVLIETLARIARWPVLLRGDAVARETGRPGLFSARDVRRYQLKALRESADLLDRGGIVVVFPEGYPNIDPHYTPKTRPHEFLPFKGGFVAIAAAAETRSKRKVPIIPAGLCYTPGTPWIAHVRFGEATYLKKFDGARELIGDLEERVRRLSGVEGIEEPAKKQRAAP